MFSQCFTVGMTLVVRYTQTQTHAHCIYPPPGHFFILLYIWPTAKRLPTHSDPTTKKNGSTNCWKRQCWPQYKKVSEGCWPAFRIPQIPNWLSILGMRRTNKSKPRRPHPKTPSIQGSNIPRVQNRPDTTWATENLKKVVYLSCIYYYFMLLLYVSVFLN